MGRRFALSAIDVIIPQSAPRLWHRVLIERLRAHGHDVAVASRPDGATWPAIVTGTLGLERRIFRRRKPALFSAATIAAGTGSRRRSDLQFDLSGCASPGSAPMITLAFDGSPSDATVAATLAAGRLPEIAALLNGTEIVGRAAPMVDKPESVALGTEDVLARAVTLLTALADRFAAGMLRSSPPAAAASLPTGKTPPFTTAYLTGALPRLGREALRRARFRHAHWRVGYRFRDAAGVAETCRLGTGWSVLPDDSDHFYADPFAFEHDGRFFVFVEDYPHATRKAVISVVTFDADGRPSRPKPVLEEPHHLSYPQVFRKDGEIWMLPEGSASGRLTLYRAERFPDRWVAAAVLIDGGEISDATLLDHDGRLWLFATERDGYGSTSDTLAVFHASALAGPWTPHPMNPIVIDRRMARPGGAFVPTARGLVLPVQDGTLGYGGGLGLARLLALDLETVRLSEPQPITDSGDWPYPQIHTLNRAGRIEVIDGIAAVRKRSGTAK